MNITEKQKRILLNYMKDNEDFARGRLRYNSGNKKILDDMWTDISISLNAIGNGPQKQAKEWQKTWRDWKSNVLKKCAQNKSYAGGTGGGSPKLLKLTELEESLLEVIDPEAAGLLNIPEGGNFNRTKQKGFVSANDIIPKRRPFRTYEEEFLENEIDAEEAGLIEQHPLNSMQMKRKCASILASNSKMYKKDYISNYPSTSISSVLDTTGAREMESDIHVSELNSGEIDEVALEEDNTVPREQTIPKRHQAQSKFTNSSKENGSNAAVQLMRENVEMKQERLKISKEELILQKEMFKYFTSFLSDFKEILKDVNYNVKRLREEIEKLVPSYLK